MPSLLKYIENTKKLPSHLTFSLAALMAFYSGSEIRENALIGYRDGQEYRIMDDRKVLEFFRDNCQKPVGEFVRAFISNKDFFGQDLSQIEGLTDSITTYLEDIKENGMRAALCRIS